MCLPTRLLTAASTSAEEMAEYAHHVMNHLCTRKLRPLDDCVLPLDHEVAQTELSQAKIMANKRTSMSSEVKA